MFEQLLNLITRGIVALETIASHYETAGASLNPKANGTAKKAKPEADDEERDEDQDETPKSKAKKGAAKESKSKGKTKADDDDGEDEEDEPKKKKRAKPVKHMGGLDELRDEIKQYAAVISGGDDGDATEEYEDLLEDFGVKAITKLDDEDVKEFHQEIKDIVIKYYE